MDNVLTLLKTCSKCDTSKPALEFRVKGLTCKSCTSAKQKDWVKANRKTILGKRREYIKLPHAQLLRRFAHLKRKCLAYGIPFNLEPGDIVVPTYCPVFGIPLNSDPHSPFCASVDRIRPHLGYTKGNVIVVSKRANQIKSDATVDEMIKVADFYARLKV